MRSIFYFVCLGHSLAGLQAQNSIQQCNNVTDTLQQHLLKEVVIAANAKRALIESTMPVQILNAAALEQLNSLSVADAVRYLSGVQLKDYGGIGGLKTINVRSLGSAHTAVFFDGMTVGNAQNGQVDLGKFSLDNIETIELYNGQKTSLLQPARGFFASNTLFLKSKVPVFDKEKKTITKASLKSGSFGLFNPSILYQHKLSDKSSLSASTEWMKADGKYKYRYAKSGGYDTTAVRQNGDVAAFKAEFTYHVKLQNNGEATLKTYLYDSERGLPGAIVANKFQSVQRQWDRNYFFHASIEKSFFENHMFMANVKYSNDFNRYIDPDYKTLTGALDNKYYQQEWYASVVNQIDVKKWWKVALATDFSVNTLDANLYRFPYPTRLTYLGAASSAFSFDRITLQVNLLGAYINEQVKVYQQGKDQHVFCPVVALSVQPFSDANFRIRSFYKESFRMPNFNDLYYTFIGNSSLRPEFTTQFNIGATYLYESDTWLKSVNVQVDGYTNRVKDKIVAMPSSNLFRWTMMNLGEVAIKGFELGSTLVIAPIQNITMDLGFNYTFQEAIDVTPKGTTYGQQIAYAPKHSGSATSAIKYKNFQLNYSFLYTGGRYSQKANIPVNYVKPWYTSDLACNWKTKWKDNEFKFTLEVNNVFNQYYDVVLNFPMPGRNYRTTLSYQF